MTTVASPSDTDPTSDKREQTVIRASSSGPSIAEMAAAARLRRIELPRSMLAALGQAIEFTIAPPLYRRTRILTLSSSSPTEIVNRSTDDQLVTLYQRAGVVASTEATARSAMAALAAEAEAQRGA